jgi:uncharacterized membrane protein
MEFVIQVVAAMVVMAVVDVPVIAKVIAPTLRKTADDYVAKKPDLVAASIFYVLYVTLVVWFTKDLESLGEVALHGGLLGLFAYGTYEFTNKAVLAKWSWRMVVIDVVWGTILTAVVAAAAFLVGEWV